MTPAIRVVLVCAALVTGCRRSRIPIATDVNAPVLIAEGRLIPTQSSDGGGKNTAFQFGRFAVPVVIHGHTLQMMADHGSNGSILTDAAVNRLGLQHWYAGSARGDTLIRRAGVEPRPDSTAEVTITHGDTTFQYWDVPEPTPLDSLRIGASRQDTVLLAWELSAAELKPFDGLIGRDILSQFDLLFDVPAGILRLYRRSTTAANGQPPKWLPSGITRSDCLSARVLRHAIDTTGFGEDGKRELLRNPIKRMWEQEEMRLPLVVNDRSIDAMFDSGAATTVMNWREADALQITSQSPGVTTTVESESRLFILNAKNHSRAPDSVFAIPSLALRIGKQPLPADTIFISDPHFADVPSYATEPMINLGLRQIHDRKLFLSYSTGFVCAGRAQFLHGNIK